MCEFCRQSPHAAACPNAPEPRTVFICSECGEMIYEGDWFYRVLGETYCEDCMDSLKELAEVDEWD